MSPSIRLRLCFLLLLVAQAAKGDDKTRCYGQLGCFSVTGDFYHRTRRPFNVFPDEREAVKTTFLIYTRDTPITADSLSWSATGEDVRKTHFKSSRPTKLITHGWMDNIDLTDWMIEMKDSYLAAGDYNVVLVDWKGGAVQPYTKATANARLVGAEVAVFVNKLEESFGADPTTFHGIGHSLGAHAMGYAGKRTKRFGRITGLDPAGPSFEKMPPSVRIDSTDADFVDVIHTDAQNQGFGMMDPTGHIDFYPNGGQLMPGCGKRNKPLSGSTRGTIKGAFETLGCSHWKAIHYMMDSINENPSCFAVSFECSSYGHFLNGQCVSCGEDGSSCAPMGHLADRWKRFADSSRKRRMYLLTNARKPFCAYQYKISLHSSMQNKLDHAKGSVHMTLIGSEGRSEMELPPLARTLLQNASYTFVAHSDTNAGNITEVQFLYGGQRTSGTTEIPIRYAEIVPMVWNRIPAKSTSSATLRFCTSSRAVMTNAQLRLRRC